MLIRDNEGLDELILSPDCWVAFIRTPIIPRFGLGLHNHLITHLNSPERKLICQKNLTGELSDFNTQGGRQQLPPGPARFVCARGLFQGLKKKKSKKMDFHQRGGTQQLLKLTIHIGWKQTVAIRHHQICCHHPQSEMSNWAGTNLFPFVPHLNIACTEQTTHQIFFPSSTLKYLPHARH